MFPFPTKKSHLPLPLVVLSQENVMETSYLVGLPDGRILESQLYYSIATKNSYDYHILKPKLGTCVSFSSY